MSFTNWLNKIKTAEKSSVINRRNRRVHYKFHDGQEMTEEYSMDTGVLQRRVWKRENTLGGEPYWEVELGEKMRSLNNEDKFILQKAVTEPVLTKRLTKNNLEWRIRNLPYPFETYSVTATPEECCITVRTTNKKYFKKIQIPELARCELKPNQQSISVQHQHNTLIITYKKPQLLLEMEKEVLIVLQSVDTEADDYDKCTSLLKELMEKQ
ncbi:Protein DPCD [Pseudolycoriella hygida]|uniref:Protein DPCD n=1 Tax=Pseudolycoriella hygida TaxID=35572 RepID=A0A9Q0NCP1_9DIPT|nr:Protein DPCD [Pseudolycoriella hygida]